MTATDLLPRERFETILNGVDVTRVQANPTAAANFRRRFSIPTQRAIVTQVSWMIPEKGIDDFLAMARLVLARQPNVQFVLVGDGDARERYARNAGAMGLDHHITWTGMIDDPFGEGVFAAADVVCQFSRWEEVFGWMIAEAMAHAKPVVATRAGGIPEVVTDNVTGYLVERGDIAAMADRVVELLNNRELRAQLGQMGRQIVSERFDLRKNVAQLIGSYGISAN